MERKFIDLGLTSGRVWAADNEPGLFNYNEAVKKAKECYPHLPLDNVFPSQKAWEELFIQCRRRWNILRKGYDIIGPNGNKIFLPAAGHSTHNKNTLYNKGKFGSYWSSTKAKGELKGCSRITVFDNKHLTCDCPEDQSSFYNSLRLAGFGDEVL